MGALGVRGDAVARSIVGGLGRERTAALLAELRQRHTGGGYDAEDFFQAAIAAGADLEPLVGDWLNEAGLPGFLASRARVARVADDARGEPRYEVRVHVHNGESTPGLVRLNQSFFPAAEGSERARIPGNTTVEIGMVSAEPPAQLWLHPYLSLNRIPVRIALPTEVGEENVQPLVGARPSTWMPTVPDGLVVDDLDPGFSVEERVGGGPRSAGGGTTIVGGGTWRWIRDCRSTRSFRASGAARASRRVGASTGTPWRGRCPATVPRSRLFLHNYRHRAAGAWTITCPTATCRRLQGIPRARVRYSGRWAAST